MPTLIVMSPKSSIAIATCLPVVYYDYLQSTMATYSLLWLPAIYFRYLQSTMSTCSVLCLPTCSLLWLPIVYYVFL